MIITCREFNDLAESYLADDLSEKKKEAFEAHYFQCDNCFAQLKLLERLFSKEIPIIQTERKPSWAWAWTLKPLFKPVLALASLLIVVVSTLWVVNNYRQGKYLESISKEEPPIYIRTETRDTLTDIQNQTFDQAMVYYNNKQYGAALEQLNSLEDNSPDTEFNPRILFFKAVCCLETGDFQKAIKHFNVIIENKNPSYYDEAVFYKGIALLRLNDKKQALKQFQNLATGPYSHRAKAILEEINRI
ncbi:MAG: hypothetical protein QG657_384 [Acidobacteriota bacterium]|nr:hypothetical protein [Acidobacteriota bacterium]